MHAGIHTAGRRLSFAMPRLSLTKLVKLLVLLLVLFVLHLLLQLLGLKTWPRFHPQYGGGGGGGEGGGEDGYIVYPWNPSQGGAAYYGNNNDNDDDDEEGGGEAGSGKLFSSAQVYPNLHGPTVSDRILAQMHFVPKSVSRGRKWKKKKTKKKEEEEEEEEEHQQQQQQHEDVRRKVLLYYGRMEHASGTRYFQEHPCAVRNCELTRDSSRVDQADVVIFSEAEFSMDYLPRPLWQVWVMYLLESPEHVPTFYNGYGPMNWTATYRHDSTLVTPYEKYVPVNRSRPLRRTADRNYATGKSAQVAWFVSNCNTPNKRFHYARELSKHIQVDIYGACGDLSCPRGSRRCSTLLNEQYKFYLAFENSNCRDYITEKFFITGLQHDVIPVVMGASQEDYERAAPPNSFIHVDDFRSPRDLATFLQALDDDDFMYNDYFRWKGLWKNIDTLFPCRLCALAHDVRRRGHSWSRDLQRWWNGPGVCIGADSWGRNVKKEHHRHHRHHHHHHRGRGGDSEVDDDDAAIVVVVEKPEGPPESVVAKDHRSLNRHRRRRRRRRDGDGGDASKVDETPRVKMKLDAPTSSPKRRPGHRRRKLDP